MTGLVVVMPRGYAFDKTDQSINRFSFRYINDTSIVENKNVCRSLPFGTRARVQPGKVAGLAG